MRIVHITVFYNFIKIICNDLLSNVCKHLLSSHKSYRGMRPGTMLTMFSLKLSDLSR